MQASSGELFGPKHASQTPSTRLDHIYNAIKEEVLSFSTIREDVSEKTNVFEARLATFEAVATLHEDEKLKV